MILVNQNSTATVFKRIQYIVYFKTNRIVAAVQSSKGKLKKTFREIFRRLPLNNYSITIKYTGKEMYLIIYLQNQYILTYIV